METAVPAPGPDAPAQHPPVSDERWTAALKAAGSVHFNKSERLRQFLLYVCDHAIRGAVDEINEHDIGCRVFGRASGFNRSEDSIVRVEARNLRKRLCAYFEAEGSDDPIVITIPKGSYVPCFEPRHGSASVATVAPASTATPRRRLALPAVLALIIVLLVVSNLVLLMAGRQGSTPATSKADSDIWSALLTPYRHTQIVVGDTCTLADQQALGRTLSLDEYLRARSSHGLAENRPRPPMAFQASCEHTSFGDVSTVARLLDTNRSYGGLVVVKYARDLQIRDFKQDHFIILGGPRSNPWVQLFEPRLNFVRGFGPNPPLPHFRNRLPRDGEQAFYQATSEDGLSGQDYGTVAWLPNLGGTGRVLIITGASMFGMEAAAEFMTRRDLTAVLEKWLHVPAAHLPSFEILLKTTRISGTTRSTEIVAARTIANNP